MPRSPFYNSPEWRAARKKQLRAHPLCEQCVKIGMPVLATTVDHRMSINSGGAPLDPRNFASLCQRHHSQKTGNVDISHPTSRPGGEYKRKLTTTGPDGFPL